VAAEGAAERLVYVVDDDEAVRESLSALLGARAYTVRTFGSAHDFLAAAPTLRPGCLIADIRMPGMDGLELQRQLNDRRFNFPLIVITGHGDVPLAVRAMKAGALDFIEKPFAADAIIGSIEAALQRVAAAGGSEADPLAAGAAARLALLSPREREVLQGLLAGLPNKSIAYDLAISPRTVEIHRARVMDKMGAKSLSELIRMSLAAGLRPRG
jgi:two-component system, LuxR family, response regulator FixJ